jgi:hypothetical protein
VAAQTNRQIDGQTDRQTDGGRDRRTLVFGRAQRRYFLGVGERQKEVAQHCTALPVHIHVLRAEVAADEALHVQVLQQSHRLSGVVAHHFLRETAVGAQVTQQRVVRRVRIRRPKRVARLTATAHTHNHTITQSRTITHNHS